MIEEAILKKYLLYDSSIWTGLLTVHTSTDLSAYYDRQLVNITSMVLEIVGVNRKAVKTFTKVLPSFTHYVYTGFSISEEIYSNINDPYRGTG